MKWLMLAWSLTFGYMPSQNDSFFNGDRRVGLEHRDALVVSLDLDATIIAYWHLYGGITTYAQKEPLGPFLAPYRADYTAGMYWRFGNVDLGVDHVCVHGISSGPVAETWYGKGETTFFARVQGGP